MALLQPVDDRLMMNPDYVALAGLDPAIHVFLFGLRK